MLLFVHVDPGNGKLTLLSTLSSPYNTHTTTCLCRSRKRKTHFTFYTFITLQHTPLLVHVDPGNGKLTLLSTLSSSYNTHTTTCSCRSRKRKTHFTFYTFITLQHTPLLVHVDPGNGKLTLLSTLSSPYNTHTATCSCGSRKRKTHFTFYTFITLQHTPLLVHVDPGKGKLTLLSTLSSPYNTHTRYLFMWI